MGQPSIHLSEIPPDFCPVFVQHDEIICCYEHGGVPVELGFELTLDPVENAKRHANLRYAVWWHLELKRRGLDPDVMGAA